MFNPEGVKGRTAQPPHKIFNFMKYGFFDVTVNVMDANTRIKLYEFGEYHIKARCKSIAIRKGIKAAMDNIHSNWREAMYNECCLFGPHKLTAKQLWGLVDAGIIVEPNDKVVEVASCEMTSWVD